MLKKVVVCRLKAVSSIKLVRISSGRIFGNLLSNRTVCHSANTDS